MIGAYTDVLVFMLVGAAFVAVTLLVGALLRTQNPYPEKLMPYECGEVPVGEGQVRFHVRYYVFALIFVIFDVEAVFLYPWAVAFQQIGLFAFIEMLIFIAILIVGLAYAWRKRVLRWV